MDDNERNANVQQRIKKMLENKKKNLQRESTEINKRLKSNVNEKYPAPEEDDDLKPNSTKRLRRPISAMKQAESSNSINVLVPQQHQDIDVQSIITSVFDHGVKIKDLCKQKKLNKQQWAERLLSDNIFSLRLSGLLKKREQQQWSDVAESECKWRILKCMQKEMLLLRCEQCEMRIGVMIEQRLKSLNKH